MPIKKSSYRRLELIERKCPQLEMDLSDLSLDELDLLEDYLTQLRDGRNNDGVTQREEAVRRTFEKIRKRWVWGR